MRGSEVHAASHLRRRLLELDLSLRASPAETRRIIVHELFHFVWLRLGNPLRGEWSHLLARETARGELGWSAEWRKAELTPDDRARRTRRWRDYVCESFCDTAAFLYAGLRRHDEFTLAARFRARRARWFARLLQRRGGTLHL